MDSDSNSSPDSIQDNSDDVIFVDQTSYQMGMLNVFFCCATQMISIYHDLFFFKVTYSTFNVSISNHFCSHHSLARLEEMKQGLLNKIAELGKELPLNTLDELIDKFGGPEKVSEVIIYVFVLVVQGWLYLKNKKQGRVKTFVLQCFVCVSR